MRNAMPTAAAAPPRWADRGTLLQWAVALFTALLVAAPLIPVVLQSVLAKPLYDGVGALTAMNYAGLFTSPALREAVFNSLVFAFLTTAIALVLGAAAAIAVGRTDIPGVRAF